MDIIAIESKTFGQMKERFEDFFNQVRSLCGDNQDKEQWLGNDDVCKLLQISLRTLQSYRDNGILPYSQIGRKCYYRVSDIENLVSQSQINKEQQ
ncbi:MAG: helix-turn-helix domain-containing protein [Bacteroidales bacterium]|nr:helix-turn-helix domain-containing protein [Bacteroidales bacterium]